MGIKRVVDVLLHAPKDLTAAERMVLVAIGENVRDGDPGRLTWPDFNVHTLAERTGLTGKGSLKSALQRLGARGLEVRVPITSGKDGRPVYALPGKQCRYRFPASLVGEATASPNGEEGEDRTSPGEDRTSPKGRTQPRQGRTGPPPTPLPSTPPPLSAPEDPAAPFELAERRQQQERDLEETADFLESLPNPWTVGPRTAKVMAPDLLAVIRSQGWDLDDELTAKLIEKPEGVRNHHQILRIRIGDLPRRIRKNPAPPSAPLPPWCGKCADGAPAAQREGRLRLIYDDHGHAQPCPKCHPDMTSHAA
ncbi:hypothetical protein ACFZAR_05410 [Streptomyces sp. NPDC008222]|uniref:hypothetical protein n=1 Tax=Streptomyces sp. NPDC008222 TaxID=3364820 RepID=UPI0036E1CDE6